MPPTIVSALLPESLNGVNYARGRGGCPYPVDMLVIHVTEGDAASVRSWFRNPKAEVSSHYMVTKAGTIVQFVDEDDKAFHAGQLVGATAKLVRERYATGKWTPNSYGIGIEHEGSGLEELTGAQREASYELLHDIIVRRGIPVDRDHIIGHHEAKATKTCPGKISVDRMVGDLRSLVAPAPATPPIEGSTGHPRAVWSNVIGDYLAVVRYVSDTEWYYVRFKELDAVFTGARASTPLSKMPTHPGEAA